MEDLKKLYVTLENEYEDYIDKDKCIEIITLLKNVFFLGFFEKVSIDKNLYIQNKLDSVKSILLEEVRKECLFQGKADNSKEVANSFMNKLASIKSLLDTDLDAIYNGDPASKDKKEIILCYPGLFAIMVYRISHILYEENVTYLPRILSEHVHSVTGIDIHPGAKIGSYFCIDHGTGIVIGETTIIGNNVKLYQGVTLGAKSITNANDLRNVRRHPTIEDNVVIYSGASILGGNTVIGENCVIGSNVFITNSVDKNTTVKSTKTIVNK